ncbi:MAG: T9SS type A sorting domain-containing protein, partial [Crocinitomicaceae bacterium]
SQTLSIIKRFQYGYNNPNGESWALEVAHGTNSSGSVLYGTVFEQSPSPAQSFYSQSNQIVPLNQWCNIIMTYSQNTINLYINNQLVGTASDPNVTINTVGNSGISIGLSEQANGQWSPFDGSIDDIGIWNRALTQCEIHDLYLAELNSLAVSGGSDVTICAGDVLTLNGSGASNYSWSNGISDGIPHVFTQMDLGNNELILTGIDANGCIGMDTVNVLVNNTSSSTLTETALDSYTLNGQTYTQSGIYTQVIPNAAGCDSTITLNLSLNFTGISDLENDFTIAPNPTMDFVTITSSDALYDEYVLFDTQGRKVLSGSLTGTTTQLDLSRLARGNYLLQIGEKKSPIKLIKQ